MFYLIFIVNPWCSIVLRKRKWKFKNNWIYKDYIALTIWIKILTNLIFPDFKALVFTILLNQLLTYFAQWKVAQLLSEGCSVVSNSLQSQGLYSPWNSPDQNTGVPFSRGSSQLRDWAQVSHFAGGFFTSWVTRETQKYWSG